MLLDYVVHFGLEAMGSLIALLAYQAHRCTQTWHKVAIWLTLTLATTIVTVQVVG